MTPERTPPTIPVVTAHELLEEASVVLLDIEGTIAPIDFVYDVMFPYAREHARDFILAHIEHPGVLADIEALRRGAADWGAAGGGGVPIAAPHAPREELVDSVVKHVHWQMDEDLKTTGLKSLQGRIWRRGFESGELQSVLFPDVPAALARFKAEGRTVAIYSSGSVAAQRLFMTHSREGDLSGLVDGWFDTEVGPKREPTSYAAICAALRAEPADVVFCTDVVEEAQAAYSAGLQAIVFDRPGNRPLPEHSFPMARTF